MGRLGPLRALVGATKLIVSGTKLIVRGEGGGPGESKTRKPRDAADGRRPETAKLIVILFWEKIPGGRGGEKLIII